MIHTQVKRPICTPRLAATSKTNIKGRECFADNTMFCFPQFQHGTLHKICGPLAGYWSHSDQSSIYAVIN